MTIAGYRSLLERMGQCVVELVLPGGGCTYCSRNCPAILGYDADSLMASPALLRQVLGAGTRALLENPVAAATAGDEPALQVFDIVDAGGGARRIQQTSAVVKNPDGTARGIICISMNVATAESECDPWRVTLRHAAMGVFAAGIAHELRSPLNALLLAATDALDSRMAPDYVAIMEQALKQAIAQVNHCGQMVTNLLRLATDEEPDKWLCNLNDVIRRSLALCQAHAVRHEVEIACELAADLPDLMINPAAIGQLVVNLVNNAIDACACSGQVIVMSRHVAGKVRLTVQDNGSGIAATVRPHIFAPFYTTRRDSGGIGLGLSIVQEILRSHSATIEVRDSGAGGSSFVMDFPR